MASELDVYVTGAGSNSVIALPIVPVMVSNEVSGASVQTFTLLDSGSTHSFCCNDITRSLKLPERFETLSLTNLDKANSIMKTTVVSFDVTSLNGQGQLKMKNMFTKDKLQIANYNMA